MPKGFSKHERETIRKNLLAYGRAQWVAVGIGKISVEELARAAHISKGAFYQFFASKEALFVTLYEEAEANCNQQLRQVAAQAGATARQCIGHFLRQALVIGRKDPLLGRVTRSDLEALLRGASPEAIQNNFSNNVAFYGEIIEIWRNSSLQVTCSGLELAGIMQSLFIISLYVDEFEAHYRSAEEFLIEAIADKLVSESNSRSIGQ